MRHRPTGLAGAVLGRKDIVGEHVFGFLRTAGPFDARAT